MAVTEAGPVHVDWEAGLFGGVGTASGSGSPGLPEPETGLLAEVLQILEEAPHFHREGLVAQVLTDGWLRKLLLLFSQAELCEDTVTLHEVYRVVRALVLLGDTNLLEVLFGEELVHDVIGALEYDPDSSERINHRTYINEKLCFKEVLGLPSAPIRAKIHQTQHLAYVKDNVLAKHLDDHTFGTISSLMLFINVEVLSALMTDKDFFPNMFARFATVQTGSEEWRDLVRFLQELCSMSKQLQPRERHEMVHQLTQQGLFDVISRILESGDSEANLGGLDVLVSLLQHDATPLREHFRKEGNPRLFGHMVRGLLDRRSGGAQDMMLEVMRLLLDPESMDKSVEKDKFLELFYNNNFLALVIDPLSKEDLDPNTAVLIVDLLIYCMHHHGFLMKYYILRSNALNKVLKLLYRRERWTACAAVRFLRQCLGTKDDFYLRHITKNSAILPVLEAYDRNAGRRNLFDSAVLEMVDFIAQQRPSGILDHLIEKHSEKLNGLGGVFKDLVNLHEDIMRGKRVEDGNGSADGGVGTGTAPNPAIDCETSHARGTAAREEAQRLLRRRRPDGSMSLEEENYFSEDDGPGHTGAGGTAGVRGGEGAGFHQHPGLAGPPAKALPRLWDLSEYSFSSDEYEEEEEEGGEEVGPPLPPSLRNPGSQSAGGGSNGEDGDGDLLLAAKKRQRVSPSSGGGAPSGGGREKPDESSKGGALGSSFWKM